MSRSPRINKDKVLSCITLKLVFIEEKFEEEFLSRLQITLIRRVLACRSLITLCLLLHVLENKFFFLLVSRLATFPTCLFTGIRTSGLPLERCIFPSFLTGMGWFLLESGLLILLNPYTRLNNYMLSKIGECNLLSFML